MAIDERAIEELLRSELGKTAEFWRYPRDTRTPMNFVLDEAERQIDRKFCLYWVEGGSPEVFCLPGLSPSPVVFSTRYLSLTAFIRKLFTFPAEKDLLAEIAKQTLLKVMAELALHRGDTDFAVLAFTKSMIKKGIWLNDNDQVMALERGPKDEAYMATWFYGLTHELGHLHPDQLMPQLNDHWFSDERILETLDSALAKFSVYPQPLRHEARQRAVQKRSGSIIGIEQVRNEGLADMFAAGVIFKTTFDIMLNEKGQKFEIARYVEEMGIFRCIVGLIEGCRRVALVASSESHDQETTMENTVLLPVSMAVRGLMQRVYLDFAVAGYLFGTGDWNETQRKQVDDLINGIARAVQPTLSTIETGYSRAIEFALFPERRENDWALLEEFRNDLTKANGERVVAIEEAKRFCVLADALGKDSKLLRALKSVVLSPETPVRPDPTGDVIYFVPWVEGPQSFQRPFGLDTKYGHLVFVFLDDGNLFEQFCDVSKDTLRVGFSLKRAAVCVPRSDRLGSELAANMPSGQSFRIALQGTKEFDCYMNELVADTIWPD